MLTRQEKRLLKITERVIRDFIKDWRRSPYQWDTEIDIQAEIANRLRFAFGRSNIQKADYKDVEDKRFKPQRFSSVCCEPLTYYKDSKNKIKHCFPDVVVYRDIVTGKRPIDERRIINSPMLLVCEIKYESEWSGDFQKEHRKLDKTKVRYLLRQNRNSNIYGTELAYCLNFYRNRFKKEGWFKESLHNNLLKIYNIHAVRKLDN